MEEENKVPMLLEFLFGKAAETARRGASARLGPRWRRDKAWGEAFDEWLAERGEIYKLGTTKQAKLAWQRLLRERGKMPWELGVKDIEQHAAWMEAEEYAATTIYNALGIIANFYRWCDEREIDPETEPGFNPAAGVKRPKIRRYARVKLLSEGEVEALLGILQRDDSPLGKRDYALILARVGMGVPLKALQQLQWGQIEQDEEGLPQGELRDSVWVRWRPEAERVQLPGEVWKAMRASLAASGRLAGMRESDYIFAPLAEPGRAREINTAEAWLGDRYLSGNQILASLKLYGRLVKIPEEKLTLQTLRRTATRLRLDEGESIGDLKIFLNSQEEAKFTKHRLGKLPQLPEDERTSEEKEYQAQVPDRSAKPFKPGDGITHGFYANSQPEAEVLAVLAEDIQGIEEEIAGLRSLARGLVAREKETRNSKEKAKLADTHSQAASRVAEMIDAEKQLEGDGKADAWAEEFLAALDKFAIKRGEKPMSEELRAEALGGEPELTIFSRCLAEEIATVRYMLRNVLELARETQEVAVYMRLVEIYGNGCGRLVRMLKKEGSDHGRLERHLWKGIDQAIREVNQEWELRRRAKTPQDVPHRNGGRLRKDVPQGCGTGYG
jgi:hypothetical protein